MAPNQRPFYIALGVVLVGTIVFIASRMLGSHPVAIPANVVVTTADTSGFHGYLLGSATAPVEITEYGDLECPVCASYAQVQYPAIMEQLVKPGKIRIRYRDYPIDGAHRHPRIAAHALACANDQGHSWDLIEKMFDTQPDWATSSDPMPALGDMVKSLGVDVSSWRTCMESAKYAGRIQASQNEGNALGVNGTPTFLIAGKLYDNRLGSDQMLKLVDSLIAVTPVNTAPKAAGGQ